MLLIIFEILFHEGRMFFFNVSEHFLEDLNNLLTLQEPFILSIVFWLTYERNLLLWETSRNEHKNFKLTQIISLTEYRIFMNLQHNVHVDVTKPRHRTAEKNVKAWESLQGFNHAINERSWTGPASTNVHLTSMGCSNIAHCVHLITVSSGKITFIFLKLISPKNYLITFLSELGKFMCKIMQ